MAKRHWAQHAFDELQAGRAVAVRPRGRSMEGRIGDGDLVTLKPCIVANLNAGDIVLARVQGRRFTHLVLHLIHAIEGEFFLIGSNSGRLDGWIAGAEIFGIVTKVEPRLTDEIGD